MKESDEVQLLHPILQTLTGSEWEWIQALISAFNNGDIGKFDTLANNFESEVSPRILDLCRGKGVLIFHSQSSTRLLGS
jgi:hypothetical protein